MSDTKFTPGPWKYYYGSRSIYSIDDRTSIAVISGPYKRFDERVLANGYLIEAAPSLFSELTACVESIERMVDRLQSEQPTAMALWANRAAAGRAALAKARGEK